jgi:hypothetical protein
MKASGKVSASLPQVQKASRGSDIAGRRFGKLTAVRYSHSTICRRSGRSGTYWAVHWAVRCDCGVEKIVRRSSLMSGDTKSCGCSRHDAARESLKAGRKSCGRTSCRQKNPQPLSEFYLDKGRIDGRKTCCKHCSRDSQLKHYYGIGGDKKQSLIDEQGGKCANVGCGKVLSHDPKPAVDHCHATGTVRGVLCLKCNTALGMLGDSPAKIDGLLAYAKKHRQLTMS